MTPIEVVESAAKKFETDKATTAPFAADAWGCPVHPRSPEACAWSIHGAFIAVADTPEAAWDAGDAYDEWMTARHAEGIVELAMPKPRTKTIERLNAIAAWMRDPERSGRFG